MLFKDPPTRETLTATRKQRGPAGLREIKHSARHYHREDRQRARRKNVDVCKMQLKKPFHCAPPHTMVRQSGSLCHYSPSSDISGTVATKGPSGNLGGLSLMSWTLMMNSDFGSSASSVLRSKACACRT